MFYNKLKIKKGEISVDTYTKDKMILEKEFKELIKEAGAESYKFIHKNNIDEVGNVILATKDDDIGEFLRLIKNNKVINVYYSYLYCKKEDFVIEDTMIDDEDILKASKDEIEEYNKKVKEIDFSQPFFLNSFYRADEYNITINIYNEYWNNFEEAEIFIEMLKEKYNNITIAKMEKKHLEKLKEREKIMDELENVILNDSDFKISTNKKLRENYIIKFLNKEENKKYRSTLIDEDAVFNKYGEAITIVELLWNKKRLLKNK